MRVEGVVRLGLETNTIQVGGVAGLGLEIMTAGFCSPKLTVSLEVSAFLYERLLSASLEMSPKHFTTATTLFSASDQIHFAPVIRD